MAQLYTAQDGITRCDWSNQTPEYIDYHDNEWGLPAIGNIALYEKVCLEAFQCGLSWRTILLKREAFRRAFAGFDYHIVAKFSSEDVDRLLQDKAIVRNRRKIEATIHNARMAIELIESEGSLAAFFWRYSNPERSASLAQTQTTSIESLALSKALKKRGWKFVGPTTMFAFMQAMGLINDHLEGCAARERVAVMQQRISLSP